MSPSDLLLPFAPDPLDGAGPSEGQSHTEHQAALDATLFRSGAASRELVLELDAGELRLRRRALSPESR